VSYQEENNFLAGLRFECDPLKGKETLGIEDLGRDRGIDLGFKRDWERKHESVTPSFSKYNGTVWEQGADGTDGVPDGAFGRKASICAIKKAHAPKSETIQPEFSASSGPTMPKMPTT